MSGKETVADFISVFPNSIVIKIRSDIKLLQEFGLNLLSTSKVKKISGQSNVFELRTKSSVQIRLFFVFVNPNIFIILHGFVKKTNKTPLKELKTAISRKKEFDIH